MYLTLAQVTQLINARREGLYADIAKLTAAGCGSYRLQEFANQMKKQEKLEAAMTLLAETFDVKEDEHD